MNKFKSISIGLRWHVHYRPDDSRLIVKDGQIGRYHRQETVASYTIQSWYEDKQYYYFHVAETPEIIKCLKKTGWFDNVFKERFPPM